MLKSAIRYLFKEFGFEIRKVQQPDRQSPTNLGDAGLYRPLFSPWFGKGEFSHYFELAAPKTLVSIDRCYVLYTLLRQAIHLDGDIWECGVYKGGTAAMIAAFLKDAKSSHRLHLFDTFGGMPATDATKDWHVKGDFSDTTAEAVEAYVGGDGVCTIHKGLIPDTFAGLESARIAFAHIDVDIYRSVLDCLGFIWPRLSPGGFVVFDDYGFPTCPGARSAVDEFYGAEEKAVPLCLPTGQAIVFKGCEHTN